MDIHQLVKNAGVYLALYGWNVVYALGILIVGYVLAKSLRKGLRKMMNKRKLDATLVSFVANLAYALVLAFVVLAALNRIGIDTTTFVAVIGAAGLAIGLALQGSLANFAAGFLLIIFRPFKAGDFVEAGGSTGVVSEVSIFTTIMKTPDNVLIIIPNSNILGDTIKNFSREDLRRVDLTITLAYGDDLPRAKEALLSILSEDERILADPEPAVVVTDLSDTGIRFAVRSWVKNSDYWAVHGSLLEAIRLRFEKEGFTAPLQFRELRMIQEKAKQ